MKGKMEKIEAVIEFANNNLCAYLKGIDGIVGVGSDFKEVKESLEKSIELHKALCEEHGMELEKELKSDYELTYKYDVSSFLHIYGKVLSKSGLENLTGINQKQLWHYASGNSKPRRNTIEKIEYSLHEFAKSLLEVEFEY